MSINRVEIINHSKYGKGREYVLWKDDIEVTQSIQDQGKTLKVFIRDKGTVEQVNESNTNNQETQRNIFAEMAKALTDELYNDEYGYYQDWCDRAAGIMSPFVDEIIKEAEARGEARGAEKVIEMMDGYYKGWSRRVMSEHTWSAIKSKLLTP